MIDKYDGQEYEAGDEYIYWSNWTNKLNKKFLFWEHPFQNWRGALGGFSNLEVKVKFDTEVSTS